MAPRTVHVTIVIHAARLHLDDFAANASCFRIPFTWSPTLNCFAPLPIYPQLGGQVLLIDEITSYAMKTRMIIHTIGHSSRGLDEFISLLVKASANMIIDVRAFRRSRCNPQFNADTLAPSLSQNGVDYRHLAALGGRRAKHQDEPASDNSFWRERGFRNYADYAASSSELDAGLDKLLAAAEHKDVTTMCAEAVWWRSHRRIITDYLLVRGVDVSTF